MAEFILNRNYMLQGMGHGIKFVKGQPTWVPECLHREAIGIGAECIDGKVEIVDPDEMPEVELTPVDKEALFYKAFDKLTARNDRHDFGGDGKPTVEALKEFVTFSFGKKEMITIFQKYRAEKAEREAA